MKRVAEERIRKLSHDGLSLSEISRLTGVGEQTVFHLLTTPYTDVEQQAHDAGCVEVPLFDE